MASDSFSGDESHEGNELKDSWSDRQKDGATEQRSDGSMDTHVRPEQGRSRAETEQQQSRSRAEAGSG